MNVFDINSYEKYEEGTVIGNAVIERISGEDAQLRGVKTSKGSEVLKIDELNIKKLIDVYNTLNLKSFVMDEAIFSGDLDFRGMFLTVGLQSFIEGKTIIKNLNLSGEVRDDSTLGVKFPGGAMRYDEMNIFSGVVFENCNINIKNFRFDFDEYPKFINTTVESRQMEMSFNKLDQDASYNDIDHWMKRLNLPWIPEFVTMYSKHGGAVEFKRTVDGYVASKRWL